MNTGRSNQVDTTKLLKLSTYAKKKGYTRGRIYQLADTLNIVEIDGVKFVMID